MLQGERDGPDGVKFDDVLRWLFINRFSATRYMKVKRIG